MSRKYIDMDKYPRLDHFRHFLTMQQPCVSVTVQVDITDWLSGLKASGCPFFLSFQYAVVKAANQIPEFRQRIVDDKIVEYDYCNPSYIVSLPDDTYRYCNVNVGQPFAQYLKESRVKQDAALHSVHLEEEEGDVLGLLFISCVPWLNYTEAMMPYPGGCFSNPSFCWGGYKTEKYLALEEGRVTEKVKTTIPVSVFFNHALIDGIHVSRFFDNLSDELNNFDFSTKE